MGRRKKKSGSPGGRLNKTVFCPLCDTMMSKVKTKPHQRGVDTDTHAPLYQDNGQPLLVSRVFYGCGKCNTVLWFDYREDGQMGDLRKELAIREVAGIRPQGLHGKFGEII